MKDRTPDAPPRRASLRRSSEGPSETREQIIRVATVLFSERGYNGTSMTDVAGAIGVTAASLYYHFDNKQALLLSVLQAGVEEFLPSLEAIAVSDRAPEAKLRKAIANHVAFVLERSDGVSVFIRERRFLEPPYAEAYLVEVDRYDEVFTAVVSEAAAGGRLPDVDPKVLSMMILGSINSIVQWYRPDGRYDPPTMANTLVDLISGTVIRPE